jgi:formylglycine-generating enzyme required for sulfatase activity
MRFLALLFISVGSFAGTPETILPKTRELKPVHWYANQELEWSTVLKANPQNTDAWLNYYAAARFAQEDNQLLEGIVTRMRDVVPNTFEYYLIKGWHGGFTNEAIQDLNKAYEFNPTHSGTYGLLALANEFQFDSDKRLFFEKKMYEAGLLPTSLLNYSYNVLMSVEAGSVLFTEGDNTTLPLLALQDIWNIRKDVVVLNLDMIIQSDYRNGKFEQTGIIFNSVSATENNFKQLLCAALPVENQNRKFYYALTLSKENIATMKDQLYVVGLASQQSPVRMDNLTLIKENLENRFLMDYLTVDFNGESENATGKVLSANYLLPLVLLYEHYQQQGNSEKQNEVMTLLKRIATDSGKESVLSNFLKRNDFAEVPYFPYDLNPKSLEGRFKPITEKIYAEESEVRNDHYNEFMAYLVKNNLNDLKEKYKFDFSRYEEPAFSLMTNYSQPRTETKKNRYFNHHPAVNISYEGANAYCEWLTQQYNNTADRKYKKVKFRLPTLDEWQIAAAGVKNPTSWKIDEQEVEVILNPAGGEFDKNAERRRVPLSNPEIQYPWFKYYGIRNSPVNYKGCYLGNFKSEPCDCPGLRGKKPSSYDGFATMAPTKSYFPNEVGLYDVVGNVAEMIAEEGKACGGSWNHPPSESTIRSVTTYTNPDAGIGFRVFMEIIEQ